MNKNIFVCLVVLGVVTGVFCEEKKEDEKKKDVNNTVSARSMQYANLVGCIKMKNVRCFLDVADDVVIQEQRSLLAEADKAMAFKGRADDDEDSETPTQLTEAIGNLVSEFTDIVKEGLKGFFRDGKDDEEESEEEEDTDKDVASDAAGDDTSEDEKEKEEERNSKKIESRGKHKKKIHKLIALIKLLVVGAVLAAKLIILLKILAAHLQFKFLVIAFAGLLLNAARFFLDLKEKKSHRPQKVIYYEHAQHQHHYDGGEEDWSSGPEEGGYWGRSYDVDGKSAHDIAYSKQKPRGSSSEDYDRYQQEPASTSWWD